MLHTGRLWSVQWSVTVSSGHAFKASVTVGVECSVGDAADDDDVRPSLTVMSPMYVYTHTETDRH